MSVNENQNQGNDSSRKGGETADLVAGLVGRELDAAIAERVMGIELNEGMIVVECPDGLPACEVLHRCPVPNYSTDIAAAMDVVENMQQCEFTLRRVRIWMAKFTNVVTGASGGYTAQSPDVPAAEVICRAALATKR